MKRSKLPRFGLLELLLLTSAIAAWIPTYRARQAIPGLTDSIERMNQQTTDLQVVDDEKLCVRTVPTVWTNVQSWKYYVPKNADLELRFATDGIQNISLPVDYRTVPLSAGEHALSLKYTSDANEYLTELYIDKALVLTESKPKEWIESAGYSSQGDASDLSKAYPLDEPLSLRRMRYSYRHPSKKWGSFGYPQTIGCKGSYLWIAPRSLSSTAPPVFVSPKTVSGSVFWGHREGTRVATNNFTNEGGLLRILPSYFAVQGINGYSWRARTSLISVRPIVEDSAIAEIPEQLTSSTNSSAMGLNFAVRDSMDAPAEPDQLSLSFKSAGAISADGKTMRLFLHYERFPSGAQPIVELVFDADKPEAIGFLIHQAPGSTPMKACQLVTKKDALYQWQQYSVSSNQTVKSEETSASLSDLYPKSSREESDEASASDPSVTEVAELGWRSIPVEVLPRKERSEEPTTRRIRFHTTIKDFSSVLYAPGLLSKWKYEGVPNSQSWVLPVVDRESEQDIKVEVQGTRVFPGTATKIANGMVSQNVRVTIPMSNQQPVWLSYEPMSFD